MDQDGTIVIDRHLYLTEDRSRVVEEGDLASRFLWAAPGDEVSRAEAVRLGAIKAEESAAPEPEQQDSAKQRAPRANKARRPAGDKGAGEGRS